MNRERIRQIAEDIKQAQFFNMRKFWFKEPDTNSCGTPACIAGFVCARYAKEDSVDLVHSDSFRVAQKMLDLTILQAKCLFLPVASDDPDHRGVVGVSPVELVDITPAMAVQTLNHLADTGRVLWSFDKEDN